MDDDDIVTEADVDDLNRASVERSAVIARMAGSTLVVVGGLGLAAWLWLAYRTQAHATGTPLFGFGDAPDASLADRIDLLANMFMVLLVATMATALGLLVRVVADFLQARIGGSVTGFRVGDRFDD